MSKWQELREEVDALEENYKRLTAENPKLEQQNVVLRKEVEHNNRLIVSAQSSLESIHHDAQVLKKDAEDLATTTKREADEYVERVTTDADKRMAEIATAEQSLQTRLDDVVRRENDVAHKEKVNVAQSESLGVKATELADKARKIEQLVTDNLGLIEINREASAKLDAREKDIDARETEVLRAEQASEELRTKAEQLAEYTLKESNRMLEVKESLRAKEVDLSQRESKLFTSEERLASEKADLDRRKAVFNREVKHGIITS